MTLPPDATSWDDLKALLRWFAAMFGEPKPLFERMCVERRDGLLIRGWLCALETMTRALLVMAAAALPRPAALAPRAKTEPRPGRIRPPTENIVFDDIADSERWTGVAFRLLPPQRRARNGQRRQRGAPRDYLVTRPLAYRLEAVIRVAEDPGRHALKLARLLWAAPKLAWRVLAEASPRACPSFPHREVGRARGFAWVVHETFVRPNPG